jgi:hypothetical protein
MLALHLCFDFVVVLTKFGYKARVELEAVVILF